MHECVFYGDSVRSREVIQVILQSRAPQPYVSSKGPEEYKLYYVS